MSTLSSGNNPEKIEAENKVETAVELAGGEIAGMQDGEALEDAKVEPVKPEANSTVDHKHTHKILYAVIAVLVLLVLGAAGYFLLIASFSTTETPAKSTTQQSTLSLKGEVAIVEGQVEKEISADTWTAVKVGDTIAEGDTLRTGAESRAVVNLDDGSAVRLDQNSTLAFTKSSSATASTAT